MTEYKLVYFNFAALAEPIRWIFKLAKVEFDDERIEPEDWPNQKARFASGQVPLLLVDGKELTQSAAIGRYLATKFGFVTGDPYLDFKSDQVVDILTDGRLQWLKFIREQDTEAKAEVLKNLQDTVCPQILKQLSDIVSSSEGVYINGDKLTFGDLSLAHWLSTWMKTVSPDLIKAYPALISLRETVLALPEIKKWLEERPETPV